MTEAKPFFSTSLVTRLHFSSRQGGQWMLEHLVPCQRGILVEAHESDLSVASEVTQARVTDALKVGAETL